MMGAILVRRERENEIGRDEFTEVGVVISAMPARINVSLFEHEGSSTTLVNVSIPGSLVIREGGESHNVVHKYVAVLPPECDKRDGNVDIDECPPCRQQAAVCPPGSIALDASKRVTLGKGKEGGWRERKSLRGESWGQERYNLQ
jgi:hypothetical protein